MSLAVQALVTQRQAAGLSKRIDSTEIEDQWPIPPPQA